MLIFLINLIACSGPTTSYSGHSTDGYFALDGTRGWTYSNAAMSYTLEVEKMDTTEVDNFKIVTLEYKKKDQGDVLGTIQWSSDSTNGIAIHGYSVSNQMPISFEKPVRLSEYKMIPGDSISTETDGVIFTSIFDGVETCPNNWITEGDDWECLKFSIEDDGTASSYPFIGEYWLANTWGASRFITPNGAFGSENTWILDYANWTKED